MDKFAKLYRKLTPKERARVELLFLQLASGDTQNLDIKKLKGFEDVYRLRSGSIRIVFLRRGSNIDLLDIGRRDENTYRKY